METKKLLSRADFEHEYGPRKQKFYNLINSGDLKAVKIGSRTYVRRQDADEWAKNLKSFVPRVPS